PEEVQNRIFDRFYQVDQSSTRAAGGTGLGLYICRKLADAIGGELWLESSGSEGSVFSLRIPVRSSNFSTIPKNPPKAPLYVVPGGVTPGMSEVDEIESQSKPRRRSV
ncbi:MAG: ATP-binding protein, partial [Actinomycetota bacterium]|nr:ATP-binding protein [Actinomycetota bacterium]